MSYLFRSCMFVPSHNDRLLASAVKSDADTLLLDLEDSVQPKSNKKIARTKIVKKINNKYFEGYNIFPRVNDRESGLLLDDVMELTIPGVDGFMYPKSKSGKDIYFFDKLLESIEAKKDIKKGTFKIMPLIETTSAVAQLNEICESSNRIVAIAFGCEDYITDLGGVHDPENESIFVPRALIANAAKANNIVPIDTVHIKVHDLADLERNLIVSRKLGYEGMLILHPKEIELAHKYYSPSEEEIKNANEMLLLYEESVKAGKGVAVKDNKFIGPPMVAIAKNILMKSNFIKNK